MREYEMISDHTLTLRSLCGSLCEFFLLYYSPVSRAGVSID